MLFRSAVDESRRKIDLPKDWRVIFSLCNDDLVRVGRFKHVAFGLSAKEMSIGRLMHEGSDANNLGIHGV